MKSFTTIFLLLLAPLFIFGQAFQDATESFGRKKVAYMTDADGNESEVFIKKFKFKKGLVKEVKFQNEAGKKVKVKPEAISSIYVPIDWSEKVWNSPKKLVEKEHCAAGEIDPKLIGEGYAYYEKAEVFYKKKKKQVLMMQVLNPTFSSKVKIYNDPLAGKTAGIGIGGLSVGKHPKSYFMSVNGATAVKIEKKKFPEQIIEMLGGCQAVQDMDVPWKELAKMIYAYDTSCE